MTDSRERARIAHIEIRAARGKVLDAERADPFDRVAHRWALENYLRTLRAEWPAINSYLTEVFK